MRIKKHGNTYELGELTCPKCECVFTYNAKDITVEEWTDYNSYYHDTYDEKVVHCPECHARMTLEGKLV